MTYRTVPLIGVSADRKSVENRPFHAAGEKYLAAVTIAGTPLIIPALEQLDIAALVDHLDAVFLTGSLSNVHPEHYQQTPSTEHEPYDQARDRLTLRLITEALDQGVPLLAVCRGFQELNVALGGTLHPAVHARPGRLDHRMPEHQDEAVRYGPSHDVQFIADGQFAALSDDLDLTIRVNSLHRQAIDDLAPGLRAEGFAPDGTIEAVSVREAKTFALAVQWHPEYQATENSFSLRLFQAFGAAAQARAQSRYR